MAKCTNQIKGYKLNLEQLLNIPGFTCDKTSRHCIPPWPQDIINNLLPAAQNMGKLAQPLGKLSKIDLTPEDTNVGETNVTEEEGSEKKGAFCKNGLWCKSGTCCYDSTGATVGCCKFNKGTFNCQGTFLISIVWCVK